MTRTPRSLVLAALATTAALVLTGCGDGTVRAGAAATVGGSRITTTTLNEVVTRGLADPSAEQTVGSNRAEFERTVLGRLIEYAIVDAAAEAEGVTVTGGEIDQVGDRIATQLGGVEQLNAAALKAGIALADLRDTLKNVALQDALADKLTADLDVPDAVLRQGYEQNLAEFDKVRSAHILVPTKSSADKILAELKADPAQFSALAAKFSTDTSNKDNGGDLGFQGRGALEKPFEDAIFNNKPGALVIAKTQFGYHVISVLERRTTTFAQAKNQLRRELLGEQRQLALASLLQKTAKGLGIHVNPRFGVWDAEQRNILEAQQCPDAFSSPSPRPATDGGAADAAPQPTASPVCP